MYIIGIFFYFKQKYGNFTQVFKARKKDGRCVHFKLKLQSSYRSNAHVQKDTQSTCTCTRPLKGLTLSFWNTRPVGLLWQVFTSPDPLTTSPDQT